MKNLQLYFIISLSFCGASCSIFSKSQPATVPLPPKSLNASAPIMLPQPGNTRQQSISESSAAQQNESQVSRKKVIMEDRGPGGSVNKITVDNPGNVPDYYIYPPQQQYNNNPDKISPPNWQYNW